MRAPQGRQVCPHFLRHLPISFHRPFHAHDMVHAQGGPDAGKRGFVARALVGKAVDEVAPPGDRHQWADDALHFSLGSQKRAPFGAEEPLVTGAHVVIGIKPVQVQWDLAGGMRSIDQHAHVMSATNLH